jgi:hypothetical protein
MTPKKFHGIFWRVQWLKPLNILRK